MNTYGPSGTVMNHDALCILPVNILNEKIYLAAWFIMFTLALITLSHHLVSSIIILTPGLRRKVLCLYLKKNRPDLRRKLTRLLDMTSYGDWLMLFMLAKNTDAVIFSEVVDEIKYPDYRFDLDDTDSVNEMLEKLQYLPRKHGYRE